MTPTTEPLESFMRHWAQVYGFEQFRAIERCYTEDDQSYVDLQVMVLPERLRRRGYGSRFMKQI